LNFIYFLSVAVRGTEGIPLRGGAAAFYIPYVDVLMTNVTRQALCRLHFP